MITGIINEFNIKILKFPTHFLLDFSETSDASQTPWALKYSQQCAARLATQTQLFKTKRMGAFFKKTHVTVRQEVSKSNANARVLLSKNLSNYFDLIFLKKEKMYTKLKYSRTPQYDIVSGGIAALFAGFLGFLICEKFGFELVDSGDFYFVFMYVVFLSFLLRLFCKIMSLTTNFSHIVTFGAIRIYCNSMLVLFLKFVNLRKY